MSGNYYMLDNGIECRDVAGEFTYNIGVAIAYLWRAGRKPGNPAADDIRKAIDHLNFELERMTPRLASEAERSDDE